MDRDLDVVGRENDEASCETNNFCNLCGIVDDYYDEGSTARHQNTIKHKCNGILKDYHDNEHVWAKNRENINVSCRVNIASSCQVQSETVDGSWQTKFKIWVNVKPNQAAKFEFKISKDNGVDCKILGIDLAHPQPQFQVNKHRYAYDKEPQPFEDSSIIVSFKADDIGHYEMPIVFTFLKENSKKRLIIIRKMAASVRDVIERYHHVKSPYSNEDIKKAPNFFKSTNHTEIIQNETAEENYIDFFQHLLWWEEIIVRINLKKFNMHSAQIEKRNDGYYLQVLGLAEKRPSLLRGDRVFLMPLKDETSVFESVIKKIEEEYVKLGDLQQSFEQYYEDDAKFRVRFLMSRVPFEKKHEAVTNIMKQKCRIFPEANNRSVKARMINQFYNPLVKKNPEQRCAVEHIVSCTSGTAPYIVYGPPGTGKTITIVEAILQLVAQNAGNRIMVCTESNMAADHIALVLLQYKTQLKVNNFLLRANSQNRTWSVMPEDLIPVSNGHSLETFRSVNNIEMSTYKIVVTTLLHAAKYISRKASTPKLEISHLFIDEAGQATEPAALVPVSGLLAPRGHLVLAGDPKQLGPVCVSKHAAKYGLGKSLLERLLESYQNLYEIKPEKINKNYITILLKNFRSDPDIIDIPNTLFYHGLLQPMAPRDALSTKSILGLPGGDRALVFHDVHAKEQRIKNTPSFFNEKELDMLKKYIRALVQDHNVSSQDIGIVTPYIRQVFKMKMWLTSNNYNDIEVGTVESYQGKEKRVILVSTVRANCRLLDFDAKYGLGFLVDDKRFNVTLTRAKAKIIIVGNSTCLQRDQKWRIFMDRCKQYKCYYGETTQQLDRTSQLLTEISQTRFKMSGIEDALREINETKDKQK